MFEPIRDIISKIQQLDIDRIALEIANTREHSTLVIALNTEGLPTSQLFIKGEDSTGRTLESIGGGYTNRTIDIKLAKGQPVDRVTLKDTDEFYKSWTVTPFNGGFNIDADPIKDDTNLFEEWGEDIVGLQDDNLQILIDFYLNATIGKIREKLSIQ